MTTVLPAEPLHWEQRAECRNHDPELWWPISAGGRGETPTAADHAAAETAVAICRNHCPVRQECLDRAIANGERHGIWGGLLPHERAKHAQRRDVPQAPVVEQPDPPRLSERYRLVARMRDAGLSAAIIGRYYGVDERTAQRWIREVDKLLAGVR